LKLSILWEGRNLIQRRVVRLAGKKHLFHKTGKGICTMVERVYLIRHGETDWNTSGRWQGLLPVDLNDVGREQARRLAAVLQREAIDAIYTSDLSRAEETARIVGTVLGLVSSADARLRELNIGLFQGLTLDEIKQRYSQEYAAFMAEPITYVLPQGESRRLLAARIMAAWHEFVNRPDTRRIAIVTHGGAVKMLLSALFPAKSAEFQIMDIPNTSITILSCHDNEWKIHDLANVMHLGGQDSSDKDTGIYF
jgi:broad specificity phosphatase PhoE